MSDWDTRDPAEMARRRAVHEARGTDWRDDYERWRASGRASAITYATLATPADPWPRRRRRLDKRGAVIRVVDVDGLGPSGWPLAAQLAGWAIDVVIEAFETVPIEILFEDEAFALGDPDGGRTVQVQTKPKLAGPWAAHFDEQYVSIVCGGADAYGVAKRFFRFPKLIREAFPDAS